ncbi:MAG TPA: NADH-quinone oxidoreductase subunit F, partial [Bacillota bacterium]|nr:NADH-quinone oxidoreductase subunit F [Bacillota bacterium]
MNEGTIVKVGLATCGIAAGAKKVFQAFEEALRGLPIKLDIAGCMGMCYKEPLVEVIASTVPSCIYGKVTPEDVPRIVEQHLRQGEIVQNLVVYGGGIQTNDSDFIDKQQRLLLKNCGLINPESIESYIAVGGYQALAKALTTMTPEAVIEEITASGLRGRGGGGFPTGSKWAMARKSPGREKYVICNADEGDPGAFMDRSVLESSTHSVLEGMLLAGYAIGAQVGYVYIRAEYPLAIKRLRLAIAQAEAAGYLGEKILGSGFN